MSDYDIYAFDLDGTLLDTLDDLKSGVNAALSAFLLPPITREETREFVGNGAFLLMERAAKRGENTDVPRLVEVFKEEYKKCFSKFTRVYDGVLEMLQRLKKAKKRTAVVSNKPDALVKELCEKYFGDLIEIAIGENEAGGDRKKPAPEGVKRAIQSLGGGKAVYIGDSDVDVQTAKNAGIDCISVSWGFRERAFLLEHGATKIVDQAEEIF